MTDFGVVNLNASIQRVLNKTASNFAAAQVSDCYNQTKNLFDLAITNSKFNVTGDFQQQQDANVAFSCIQKSQTSAELLTQLQTELQNEVKKEIEKPFATIGRQDINLSQQQVANIVEKNVVLDNTQRCIANITNDAAIRISGSEVNIGACDKDALQAAERSCNSLVEQGTRLLLNGNEKQANAVFELSKQPCGAVKTCAERQGNFLVSQGINFDGQCDQLGTIAVKVADEVSTLVKNKLEVKETQAFSNIIWYIVIGVVAAAIIAAVVAYLRYQSNKKAAEALKQQKQLKVQTGFTLT